MLHEDLPDCNSTWEVAGTGVESEFWSAFRTRDSRGIAAPGGSLRINRIGQIPFGIEHATFTRAIPQAGIGMLVAKIRITECQFTNPGRVTCGFTLDESA